MNIELAKLDLSSVEKKLVISSIDNKNISGNYESSARKSAAEILEKKYKKKYIIFCNSGTSALNLSLEAIRESNRNEIITLSFSYIAISNSVINAKYKLVLADLTNLFEIVDLETVIKLINSKTLAIIVPNTNGVIKFEDRVYEYLKRKNIYIIQDIAESQFASDQAFSKADIIIDSYFANKIVTCGEGGSIMTNNRKLAKKMEILCDQGRRRNSKYLFDELGYNFRLSNLHVSLLLGQLNRIDEIISKRKKLCTVYDDIVQESKFTSHVATQLNKNYGLWLYPVLFISSNKRNEVEENLLKVGIKTRKFFYPVHKQNKFKNLFENNNFPNTNQYYRKGLLLPTSSAFNKNEVKYITENLIKVLL